MRYVMSRANPEVASLHFPHEAGHHPEKSARIQKIGIVVGELNIQIVRIAKAVSSLWR
jgi:hypothetical protein